MALAALILGTAVSMTLVSVTIQITINRGESGGNNDDESDAEDGESGGGDGDLGAFVITGDD